MTHSPPARALAPLLLAVLLAHPPAFAAAEPVTKPVGVPVTYALPTDGPLPRTYRVTLAVVEASNPDWIVSQFAAGVVRTVTAENGGKFTETWDGLDDNFMPVPPGTYGVKGIYAPAERWHVDGEHHSIVPRFVTGASSWMPTPQQWDKPEPFGGDPTNAPFADVDVGPNGVAVFYYQYLENGTNNPLIDLNKPAGYDQVVRAFNSGGAGGGTCTATDGESVWSFSTDGGPKFVYRADQRPFGPRENRGAHRTQVYFPDGWVTAMDARRDERAGKSFAYVAQRGRIVTGPKRGVHITFVESDTDFVDKVVVLDGDNGKTLGEIATPRPQGLVVRGETMYALHPSAGGNDWTVSAVPLDANLPRGGWQKVFDVPATIKPFDLEVDNKGRFYLSDPKANKVYQLDRGGQVTLTYGKLDAQKPGTYDPHTFMSPAKLATWTDKAGNDRLIVCEQAGPNRTSEWSSDGKLVREFLNLQTKANDGYTTDPEHADHLYIPGQQGWLTRFKVDYAKRTWTVDAVYPDVGTDPKAPGLKKPVFVRANGRAYLAGASGSRENAFNVYRLDGDRWKLSASILRRMPAARSKDPVAHFLWNDANGNGAVDEEELRPSDVPPGVFSYHGQNWGEDLSFLAMPLNGRDVYRLAPESFDAHGNPVFKTWQKLLTDPIFEARAAGKADAIHGGNELGDRFNSDWMQTDGTPQLGYYVQARAGKNFSANEGAQYKVCRYVPDGKGGYALKWRTGRVAFQGVAKEGEMYGGMRIRRPINGLVPVVDQSRCGILLYTDDGLYVDTLFPDGRRFPRDKHGVYPQPGEFFAGNVYPDPATGTIYIGMGKYTPMIFAADGWSTKTNPVRPLTTVQKTVTLAASQIATPPEIALSVRGGSGAAKIVRFSPALGGAALDGSLAGWDACEPVTFAADKDQTVEVRCQYDPEHLYLRWHARLATKFDPKPLAPIERIFTHDRASDTLSFYVQGDPDAKPGPSKDGRPGDVRVVFGLFKDGGTVRPVALGMYPKWFGTGTPTPQTYATPVGQAAFEHVGPITGAELFGKIDDDGKGFVIAASIPRSAVPKAAPFAGGYRTMANFEATFAGHNKFWWANSDGSANRETYDEPTEARLYPGSWAPAQFQGIDGGVVVRNWQILGPFGGPGAEKFKSDPNGLMPGTNKDWKQAAKAFAEAAIYPPDAGDVDLKAAYKGDVVRGYWNDPREIKWKPAEVEELDTRVRLGSAVQVYYGATWINAPADTEVELQFQGHPQTPMRWSLNGKEIYRGEAKDPGGPGTHKLLRVAKKTVTLKKGWNEVRFRAYCIGYDPARVGLVLGGAPEALWSLKLSPTPPDGR